jgi:hypothetical protein
MSKTARHGTMEPRTFISARVTGGGLPITATHLGIVDRSVEKTHVWLNDQAEELGTEDRQHAYRVLRAFLHAPRDHPPVNEAAQLSAQPRRAAVMGLATFAGIEARNREAGLHGSPSLNPSPAGTSLITVLAQGLAARR